MLEPDPTQKTDIFIAISYRQTDRHMYVCVCAMYMFKPWSSCSLVFTVAYGVFVPLTFNLRYQSASILIPFTRTISRI